MILIVTSGQSSKSPLSLMYCLGLSESIPGSIADPKTSIRESTVTESVLPSFSTAVPSVSTRRWRSQFRVLSSCMIRKQYLLATGKSLSGTNIRENLADETVVRCVNEPRMTRAAASSFSYTAYLQQSPTNLKMATQDFPVEQSLILSILDMNVRYIGFPVAGVRRRLALVLRGTTTQAI